MTEQQARARDRGSATIQTVLTMPLLGLLVFGIIQFALYFHALQIAQTAANEGVNAARIEGASDSDGRDRSSAFLAAMAGGALHDEHVAVRRDTQSVRVSITGTAEQVVPLLQLAVRASATAPIEQAGAR
jgi:Flp pilus assembly protein TadG